MTLFSAAILGGLVVGWLRGGHLAHVGRRQVRLLSLVPLALIAEVVVAYGVGLEVPRWVLPLHLGAYVLLVAVVVLNWRLAGMPLIAAGLALNALVIGLNGGLMPEDPVTLHVKHSGETIAIGQHPPRTKDVVLPHDQARLWWLGDVLTTPPGFPLQTVASPGDVVLMGGLLWMVAGLMRPPHTRAP